MIDRYTENRMRMLTRFCVLIPVTMLKLTNVVATPPPKAWPAEIFKLCACGRE